MNRSLATMLSIALLAPAAASAPRAGGETDSASIVGAWTLNKDLSDPAPARPEGDGQRARGGVGGRRGGGGVGGGGVGGGVPGGAGAPGLSRGDRRGRGSPARPLE